jgi:flagellar hook-basal body complex protein FliE
MSVEAIAAVSGVAVPAIQAPGLTDAAAGAQTGVERVFDALVTHLQELNTSMSASAPAANALALGNTEQLESVLLEMERVRVQFDFMMSVRNRLLEGYQELMRMQV